MGITSTVAGIGGSLLSSSMASDSASAAADAQTAAADRATQAQMDMFNRSQENLKPFMTVGTNAVNYLMNAMNGHLFGTGGYNNGQDVRFTNADLNAHLAPNYQFQLEQGQKALQNSQAAQNGVLSGAALKEMQKYTQDTAAGAYQNAYNNWFNTTGMNMNNYNANQNRNFGQWYNLASLGENAAATSGNNAIQTGQSVGNNIIGAGNAQAAGHIASGNAWAGGLNNALGYYNMGNLMGSNGGGNNWGSVNTGLSDLGSLMSFDGF